MDSRKHSCPSAGSPQEPAGFNKSGEFVRNAYVIYLLNYMHAPDTIKLTNRKLYIEATFNSLSDVNYELWILRTYVDELAQLLTIGMVLIPKDQLYATDEKLWPKDIKDRDKYRKDCEATQKFTLKMCFQGIIRSLYLYTATNIFMGSKKDINFLLKVRSIVREIDPKI